MLFSVQKMHAPTYFSKFTYTKHKKFVIEFQTNKILIYTTKKIK